VLVHPGELILADFDGIVVVLRAVEATVLRLAADKVDKESASRADLLAGKSLREVYEPYHVL
jgi:4-hydroxy-4-methyl-2-oxoglutarate aldolase